MTYNQRFRSAMLGVLFALVVIMFFLRDLSQSDSINMFIAPILAALFTLFSDRKKIMLHTKKFYPQQFFEILEKNLTKNGHAFTKKSKANDEYISNNYITHYYFDESNQQIKIKWKDLETSNIEAEFKNFVDKDLIKELSMELKEGRQPISFSRFNKYSLIFAAIAAYIGIMMLLDL